MLGATHWQKTPKNWPVLLYGVLYVCKNVVICLPLKNRTLDRFLSNSLIAISMDALQCLARENNFSIINGASEVVSISFNSSKYSKQHFISFKQFSSVSLLSEIA